MRHKLLLFVCLAIGNVVFRLDGAMANFDGYIDIDDSTPDAESSNSGETKDYGKGEDDEDGDGSGVMSEESGSGSGESTKTDSNIDVTVESAVATEPSTSAQGETTTEISNEITNEAEETTKGPSGVDEETVTEDEDNVFGGGVGGETLALEKKDQDNSDGEKEVMKVLTTEVIAAVVVGAVCALILIAFLVYRLRKRDEGSYSLSDIGYKDTYKLHADNGKEAFV